MKPSTCFSKNVNYIYRTYRTCIRHGFPLISEKYEYLSNFKHSITMQFRGSIVKKTRKENGHKQYFFARLTSISQSHLSKIENGKSIPSRINYYFNDFGKEIRVFCLLNLHKTQKRLERCSPSLFYFFKYLILLIIHC